MNIITQQEFLQALAHHAEWIEYKDLQIKNDTRGNLLNNIEIRRKRLRIEYCDISQCFFKDYTDMSDCMFREVNFSQMRLIGLNFSHSVFIHCKFANSTINQCNFSNCVCTNCDFTDATIEGTSFHNTDLTHSSFYGANIDYSSFPLSCNTLNIFVDEHIAAQFAYHFCRLKCDNPDFISACNAIRNFANTFHRVDECGILKEITNDSN